MCPRAFKWRFLLPAAGLAFGGGLKPGIVNTLESKPRAMNAPGGTQCFQFLKVYLAAQIQQFS
jgi:hypothetical protein